MGRPGFFLNMNTCLGCGACQVACKDLHDLLPGEFFRRVDTIEVNSAHGTVYAHFSGACNHCEEAACVAACPTGAMHKAADGTVVPNSSLCIACGSCMWNCPNGAISLSQKSGNAQKCDACEQLRARGLAPACTQACPTRSLEFGDLDDLMTKHGVTEQDLSFLPVAAGTDPSLIVKLPDALRKAEEGAACCDKAAQGGEGDE